MVNFDGLDFPVHPRQISKFEKNNATISVNVYMLELVEKALRVFPYNLTKAKKEHHVNLLLIQPEDTYMDIKQEVPDDSEADHQGPTPYHSGLRIFLDFYTNKTPSTMVGCTSLKGVFTATTPMQNLRLMKWTARKSTSAV